MKILITGGHVAPALAVIDKIKEEKPEIEIVFVGRKYALESEETLSLEYKEIEMRKIRFISLRTGRATRVISIKSLRSLIKVPLGFFHSWQIVRSEKPDRILSFGGYLALPIAIIGWLFKVPVYTHEQTINPGLSNKIIGRFSRKVFVAFKEAAKYFNKSKTLITGNPIRSSVFKIINKPFAINEDRPVIYITGGSLGSHSINLHVKSLLQKLLDKYTVIHQTGDTKEYADYEELLVIRQNLSEDLKKNYFLRKHFLDDEIGYIYSLADLVVSRAGANTYFELLALRKPAIMIPLPWSANKEQQRHAELFKQAGLGEIFFQSEKSSDLLTLIDSMIKNLVRYQSRFNKLESLYKKDASTLIIKEVCR